MNIAFCPAKLGPDPDELAAAVRDLIEANGDCLSRLTFTTKEGSHSYDTIRSKTIGGTSRAYLIPG